MCVVIHNRDVRLRHLAYAARSPFHLIEDELGLEIVAHDPTDDPATEGVDDDRQMQESYLGRDIGDVGEPEHVRAVRIEVAVDQIAGRTHPFILERDSCTFSPADTFQRGGVISLLVRLWPRRMPSSVSLACTRGAP